jgi:hypothetical protein
MLAWMGPCGKRHTQVLGDRQREIHNTRARLPQCRARSATRGAAPAARRQLSPPASLPHVRGVVVCVVEAAAPVAEVRRHDKQVGGVVQVRGQQPPVRGLCRRAGGAGTCSTGQQQQPGPHACDTCRQVGIRWPCSQPLTPLITLGKPPPSPAHPPPTRVRGGGPHHDGHQGEGAPRHDVQDVGQVQLQAVLSLVSLRPHLLEAAGGPQLSIYPGVDGCIACRGVQAAAA